ncbi:MAG: glutamyl-tRNA reductase [Bacteroidia bacterium]|nr:glutamyl-tRNA reductase [Bacteroidia bacterium]
MNFLRVLSFSHKRLPLAAIGKLSFSDERISDILGASKEILQCEEVFCLSTCNRSEWILYSPVLNHKRIESLLKQVFGIENDFEKYLSGMELFEGEEAVNHVFRLCSSLESMVIGEREILAQTRKAFDKAFELGYASDKLRILMRFATECAKEVYTNTRIAEKPVSIASLAYRELAQRGLTSEKTFLVIGAGETNWKLLDYLRKNKNNVFYIFNRTLHKAKQLAEHVGGEAFELQHLSDFQKDFDALMICTSSPTPLLNEKNASRLFQYFKGKKVIVDLSVPRGIEETVLEKYRTDSIFVDSLNEQAKKNLCERAKEIRICESIIEQYIEQHHRAQSERVVELIFGEIPKKVRETKEKAIHEVFSKEISMLDDKSKEVLMRVLDYMEKKYNTFTMCSAKEILLGKDEHIRFS